MQSLKQRPSGKPCRRATLLNDLVILANLLLLTPLSWPAAAQHATFHRGFNLTGWFQKPSVSRIQINRYTSTDFQHIKELGCDHIRLPINLLAFADENGHLDAWLLEMLDTVLDRAENAGLTVVLDNHTFDPHAPTDSAIRDKLVATWQSMAEHFKNRPSTILYEVLNEPHGISDAVWAAIQSRVILAIRQVDSVHTIVVGPANWNSYRNLGNLPQYPDTNLIYTFHFYEPFLFTHQGASWTTPPMVSLAGVPFPYDATRMPGLPGDLRGTWLESRYFQYPFHGRAAWVEEQLKIAVDFSSRRGVPVWCGEFGAYMPHSTTEDRARWLQVVRTCLEENGIPWTMWAYAGGFGIFEPESNQQFESDLNIPILEALGLRVPPQTLPHPRRDTTGFQIYDDDLSPGIWEDSWAPEGRIDLHWELTPHSGIACLHFANVGQYNCLGLRFVPVRDFSYLVEHGFALDMWVRCNSPNAKIDVRFVDTKSGPGDHPWRMRVTLGGSEHPWMGSWEHVVVPLAQFQEHGSWDDNQWYDPEGLFDWHAVERFEIVAEYAPLYGIAFDFDALRIVGQEASVGVRKYAPQSFAVEPSYPNPFYQDAGNDLRLPLELPRSGVVRVKMYNARGQLLARTSYAFRSPGRHELVWSAAELEKLGASAGVYVFTVQYGCETRARKFVVVK